jgi:transglutaminase-like putative cysteine protease
MGQRLVHGWRTLFAPGDVFTLLVALLLLVIPVVALTAAGWPLDLRAVLPIGVLSIVFGFLLARSQYNELVALMMSNIYGLGFTLLFAALTEPGGIGQGVVSLLRRTVQWTVDAFNGGINQDPLVFTLLVSLLVWFLGYNIAWHIFRIDRVWRVILPPGLILIVNNVVYTGPVNLDGFIVAFLFLALMLVVRSSLDARAWEWYVNGIRVPASLRNSFFRVGTILALLVLIGGALIPTFNLRERLDRFQEFLASEPLTELGELWNRLFEPVETEGPTTADYYGSDSLQLGGAIRLGEQEVFSVQAPPGRRYYWRSRVFDIYESGRWSPAATTRLTVPESPFSVLYEAGELGGRTPIQQRFTMALNSSRLVYVAPQPLQIDLPTRTDLRYIPDDEARSGMNLSVTRPLRVLRAGDQYTVTSLLTTASAADLRAAGTAYPDWLVNLYLQVPPSISERTVQLARQIVGQAGASTPYDQARAIEAWLRANIIYNESIPQPPAGVEPVEWLLFDFGQGYCNYYASAMAMMLRVLGVPARMVAGFAQGDYDSARQEYIVEERDAHTWVEVYFPGYGWVEFEPTAAQAPVNRVDDMPLPNPATATPAATPTPTATATPSPSPTPDPSTPQPAAQQGQFPTLTPTFTPSPTATPVIVPTQPPPAQPQQRGLLSLILPALGVALLVISIIAVVIGALVFLWWWWEWRGMRGLSPISRAWARLERYIGLIGLRPNAQQTPEERRSSIVRALPPVDPPVTAITRLYSNERYGRPASTPRQDEVQSQIADEAWSDARVNIVRRWLWKWVPFAGRRKKP